MSLYNAAYTLRAIGDATGAQTVATEALDAFEATGATSDAVSAHTVRAWAMAHRGSWDSSLAELDSARPDTPASKFEHLMDSADVHLWYGTAEAAQSLLVEAENYRASWVSAEEWSRVRRAWLSLRLGRLVEAAAVLDLPAANDGNEPASTARKLVLRAWLALLEGGNAVEAAEKARLHAGQQGSVFWSRCADVLSAAATGTGISGRIQAWRSEDLTYLSILAEVVAPLLGSLGDDAWARVTSEIRSRPARWVEALRREVDNPKSESRYRSATLLDEIGGIEDIQRLRRAARMWRQLGDAQLGRGLARRLARRVDVEDQGRVIINVGDEQIAGTAVRRKVLALLCFLITKPNFSATRDQVLDSLWPDLDPDVGLNSLNQTLYFLRRVFEPAFSEDLSPGYVHNMGDIVWLDRELVTSRSRRCSELIKSMTGSPSVADVQALSDRYQGRFALDFAYEDWAAQYRGSLHASYLQTIEAAIGQDMANGHFDRGIQLARRAIEIDPEAEQLELSLLRLYRVAGAHSAAAEQYSHYAAVMRESVGVEPPPLDSL